MLGPPNDVDAEAAVLSAIMLAPRVLDEVRDIVTVEDFFSMQHRVLFEAMLAVDAASSTIDVVTLAHHLKSENKLQQIGGTAFLAQMSDCTPSVANVLEHARIVRSFGALRRAGQTLRSLSAQASMPETRADVPSFLQRCEAEIFNLNAAAMSRETASSMHDLMGQAMVDLDPSKPREPRGIGTGLAELDEISLGLGQTELWYLAARPGMGKTALALNIAAHVASTGRHVLFYSLEMDLEDLRDRLLSAQSGVAHKLLKKRELTKPQWAHVMSAMHRLSRLPMICDEDRVLSPSRLRSRIRRHAAKLRATHPGKLGLIVVDYVQLMSIEKHEASRNGHENLERISRALKLIAGEFNVPVLALAQLNRALKDRADKRPNLMDLRGSGALEQDADKVLLLHRDEAEGEERGEAELILAKGRNAGTGRVVVRWEPWCVRFVDAERRQGGFDYSTFGDDDPPSLPPD